MSSSFFCAIVCLFQNKIVSKQQSSSRPTLKSVVSRRSVLVVPCCVCLVSLSVCWWMNLFFFYCTESACSHHQPTNQQLVFPSQIPRIQNNNNNETKRRVCDMKKSFSCFFFCICGRLLRGRKLTGLHYLWWSWLAEWLLPQMYAIWEFCWKRQTTIRRWWWMLRQSLRRTCFFADFHQSFRNAQLFSTLFRCTIYLFRDFLQFYTDFLGFMGVFRAFSRECFCFFFRGD